MANKNNSFESSLSALESAVERLEKGDLPLEEALACFESGVKAAGSCQKFLKDAELKVEKLRRGDDGELLGESFTEDPAGE